MRAGAELADQPLAAVLAELRSSPAGLSDGQARERLERFGLNEIPEERKSPLLVLAGYFWAPIPWMIEVALVLSLVVRHWTDAGRCPQAATSAWRIRRRVHELRPGAHRHPPDPRRAR